MEVSDVGRYGTRVIRKVNMNQKEDAMKLINDMEGALFLTETYLMVNFEINFLQPGNYIERNLLMAPREGNTYA